MRHAFDVRQGVSFRTLTGGKEVHSKLTTLSKSGLNPTSKSQVSLNRVSNNQVPRMTSASIEFVESNRDPKSRPLMLAKLFPEAKFFGCDDLCLSGLATDVSDCQPGDVVIHRIGEGDPNDLIANALAFGAGGILTEQLLPCPLPQCIVGSVDHALARIASVQQCRPDRKLLSVGILGHSGKTSTCLLAATMTKALGIRTAYQCDLGSSDGVVSDTSSRTVPNGAELIDWLAESSDCLSRVAIIEIDEASAREGHYDSMQFDILIVTGKRELSDDFGPCGLQCLLERLTATGVVILPDGDVKSARLLESAQCHHLKYGTTADSEFGAIMIDQSGGMSTLMLSSGDTSAMMETPLCGKGMASNIAAVVALGGMLGHSPHEIATHLSALRSIPGRGQRLVDFGQATVVIETGGTAERVCEALRTAKATGVGGKIWCVLSIGEGDDEEQLARFGRTIERFAHQCVVTSKPNQNVSFLKRSHQLLDGVKECAAIRLVADQDKAIGWAIESSRPRDTVVVITNQREQTAHESRTDCARIESLVQSIRVKNNVSLDPETESDPGTPIKLKLFP